MCRATSAPQPTSARHPNQGTAEQYPACTEREVLEGSLAARRIQLAAFQDGRIERQEKELRGERRLRSRRQADDCCGAEPSHEVLGVAAKRSPRNAVRRCPREDCQSNDATSQYRLPERGKRRLQQSMQVCRPDVCLRNTAVMRTSNDQVERRRPHPG
jgi:hypothetical protein